MNTNTHEWVGNKKKEGLIADLGREIIGAAFQVQNTMGTGFLEKVYKKSLVIELQEMGVSVEEEKRIDLYYRGKLVGEYYADIVVNNEFIVEIKSTERLTDIHTAQLLNYLKATGIKKGLLINFGRTKVEFKRYVL